MRSNLALTIMQFLTDNEFMQKAFRLLLVYFLMFLASLAVGTFVYLLFTEIQGHIAGQNVTFFDKDLILKAVFLVSYSVCFLICPFVSFYKIRHTSGLAQSIMFVILVIVTWCAVFPGLNFLEKFSYKHLPETNKISHLSGNYFRKDGSKIYYFTRDFYSDDTNTVVIDTSDDGVVSVEKIEDTPDFPLYNASKPYNEVEIKKVLEPSPILKFIDLRYLSDMGLGALASGWTFYLGFISIALVLGALFFVSDISEWKLLNSLILILGTILVLFVNDFLYSESGSAFVNWAEKAGFIKSLKKVFDNPVLVLINLLSFIILTVTAIISLILKKHKKED